MSWIKMLDSIGNSTDPCGILFPTSLGVDWYPFTLTDIELLCERSLIKLNILPLFSNFYSFSINPCLHTISKAFL